MYIWQALSYIKMEILFQPITDIIKPFIHNTFRVVIGCHQPITSSITYHHLILIKPIANGHLTRK